ncbi:LacI family transcriptional regulator [Brachybacterium alimentarium]|uniref:LacI family transcriptional regulator n=1 Tax=Brachybacterium alimentarium TaxID=47845 RepID=A0A2A3YF23_9MICO|nr:LacI family DNA-binding transcriptional regulator [Brachybacterium alimentarium]PCC37894.1 LacI family transcriptional regulator [Brachybacterium alimentarium]
MQPDSTKSTSRATIWQVAAAAGVSHQTVSRFLRADTGMKPQTQERVRLAIAELGYRPNLSARTMRTRRTQRIGVLLPAVSGFQASALSGAIDIATAEGYALEVLSVDGDAHAAFERVLQIADSGQVDGVLALAPLPPETENSYPGRAAIVASADYDENTRSMGAMANGAPIAELMDGLHRLGHRRFLHVTGDLTYASARNRREVFIESVDRLRVGPPLVHTGVWSASSGYEAITSLAEQDRPTAVIAGSDTIAAGVINGARERGWRVPEDLSVTGWDNQFLGAHLRPTLTTVKDDRRQLGRNAMSRLIAALRELPLPEEESLSTVIWRGSTGPVPD